MRDIASKRAARFFAGILGATLGGGCGGGDSGASEHSGPTGNPQASTPVAGSSEPTESTSGSAMPSPDPSVSSSAEPGTPPAGAGLGRTWLSACSTIAAPCDAELLRDDFDQPRILRPRPEGLYFIDEARLLRIPLAGGDPESIREASGSFVYFDLGADDTLFYSTSEPATLQSGALNDALGDVVLIADEFGAGRFYGLAVTPTEIYLGRNLDTLRVPRDGTPADVISQVCTDLVWDDAYVHCRAEIGAATIERATGAATLRYDGYVDDAEVTPNSVYFVELDSGAILRGTPAPSGSLTPVASLPSANTLASDTGGVYFTARSDAGGIAVHYLADSATAAVPVARAFDARPVIGSTGIDATHVYWSTYEMDEAFQPVGDSGAIYRAPRCGCP